MPAGCVMTDEKILPQPQNHMPPASSSAVALEPASISTSPTTHRGSWSHRFYLLLTLALIGTVLVGFWPSYYGSLLGGGGTSRAWIMHLHGAIYSGWMLLLLLQVGLAATGRIAAHRRVGTFGIWYGAAVLVIGLIVSFAAPVMHIRAGEWTVDRAAGFMILPLVDMILFGGFFGGAIVYRNRPEVHKRLIFAATVAVVFAAVARMNLPPLWFYLVWMAPMLAGVAFDWTTRRRVHPVYLISIAAMTIAFTRVFLMTSEPWLVIGRALLAPFV